MDEEGEGYNTNDLPHVYLLANHSLPLHMNGVSVMSN